MITDKLLKIKSLINKSKLESAKSEGRMESIKKGWKEKYGFDSVNKANEKLEELKQELENSTNRLNKVYNELLESQDWDKLEEELN